MAQEADFVKIRLGLALNPNIDITSRGIDGRPTFRQEFMDKLYEYEEEFRIKLILPINEAVGLHNWAIQFIEFSDGDKDLFADIYVDNPDDYPRMINIIRNILPDKEFHYYHKGMVNDYKIKG